MDYLVSQTRFVDHWYHQRFSPDNMLPHFFSMFTNGSVDTVPVETRKPVNSSVRSSIYTGKSKRCCLKWQVVCDNLGHIIHVRGPFSSLDYDGHIWDKTYHSLGVWDGREASNPEYDSRYEVFIGDNHYMNSSQCAVPIKRESGNQLDPLEQQYNNFLGSVRSTIEQVFGYLKTWSILGGVYRGMLMHDVGYRFLSSAFLLCCELYNARFTILGHNKRDIKVLARDSSGNPLFPPQNMTPENYRLRVNLHHQLSNHRKIFKNFYRAVDVVSGSSSLTFKRNDLVWVFDEDNQDFLKAIVTGVVRDMYSCRSSCKKFIYQSVHPNNVFPRSAQNQTKPTLSLFVVSAIPPISSVLSSEQPSSLHPLSSDSVTMHTESKTEMNDEYSSALSMDIDFLDEMDDSIEENGSDTETVHISSSGPLVSSSPSLLESVDIGTHPIMFFANLPSSTRICVSPSEDFDIVQSDTKSLHPGGWISDQIINFFVDNANSFELETSPFHICFTYYFVSLFRVNSHGDIGSYSFPSVKKVFVRGRIRIWEKHRVCFPINIKKLHWICLVVDIKQKSISIIDSLPNFLNPELVNFLHTSMHQWVHDQLQHSLECISAPNNFLYIDDAVERETVNRHIRMIIQTIPDFTYSKKCIWEQSNGFDCGIYALVSCYVYAFNEPVECLTNLSDPESCKRIRDIFLNFFRFKYISKSEENFNPKFFFELIKNK